MHKAIDLLEADATSADPADAYAVTNKALTSAIKVIARADDSDGIIGDACRRLLALHPRAAARAEVAPSKLVDWMMAFQFDGEVDYFELDPVAYAPALGADGLARYRARLAEKKQQVDPLPPGTERWATPASHARFVLDWNERRLVVLDRDVEAIIRTHARDRWVAAWLEDAAEALEEIGEMNLAIDWAKQAVDFDRGHQSLKASDRWCRLLAEHRPDDVADARLHVSGPGRHPRRRSAYLPTPAYRDEVMTKLAASPRDAVVFALLYLEDVPYAWELAHSLEFRDADEWLRLVQAYENVEPLAVVPILAELAESELTRADAQSYRAAARHLKKMRELAAGTVQTTEVDALVAQLRETHRRRPRLQQEFDRAGLP